MTGSSPDPSMDRKPLRDAGFVASGRGLTGPVLNSGGGTRTPDTRIMIPRTESDKVRPSKGLRIATPPPAHHLPTDNRRMPPDLAAVADAWPTLPEALRPGSWRWSRPLGGTDREAPCTMAPMRGKPGEAASGNGWTIRDACLH